MSFTKEAGKSGELLHTIVICTAGRPEVLKRTLELLPGKLTLPGRTELLIVNNGRREETPLIRHHVRTAGIPCRVTVAHEPKPGLSSARNKALQLAKGGIITMLDDDASPVDTAWQERLLRVFREQPEVGLCGGPSHLVVPEGTKPQPWWRSPLTDELMSCFPGPESGPCGIDMIIGVNASYRRTAVQGLQFDEQLGWNDAASSPLAGEETLFNKRLLQNGWKAWFEREAPVLHRIGRSRYQAGWPLRRSYIGGRTAAMFDMITSEGAQGSPFKQQPVSDMMKCLVRMTVRALQGKLPQAFSHACRFAASWGYLSFRREWSRSKTMTPIESR
ncbi:glycosyltransferase family 2 protein [Paenibacillus sp. GD4]|uniref:glycosyltransferase family 2 protein n=1 Tax=Paenibacillus sp. GD4 TaxID=3068890 RepID=UPI002796453F|nr:glycosyltransferase family 2 protein [Paenibacillus sp. GD4]MDQ1910396.1 glycosyltransferase family 2 protein [Paenibacillus sp. GD4]